MLHVWIVYPHERWRMATSTITNLDFPEIRCPISLPKSYLFWREVVWGRYNLTWPLEDVTLPYLGFQHQHFSQSQQGAASSRQLEASFGISITSATPKEEPRFAEKDDNYKVGLPTIAITGVITPIHDFINFGNWGYNLILIRVVTLVYNSWVPAGR